MIALRTGSLKGFHCRKPVGFIISKQGAIRDRALLIFLLALIPTAVDSTDPGDPHNLDRASLNAPTEAQRSAKIWAKLPHNS